MCVCVCVFVLSSYSSISSLTLVTFYSLVLCDPLVHFVGVVVFFFKSTDDSVFLTWTSSCERFTRSERGKKIYGRKKKQSFAIKCVRCSNTIHIHQLCCSRFRFCREFHIIYFKTCTLMQKCHKTNRRQQRRRRSREKQQQQPHQRKTITNILRQQLKVAFVKHRRFCCCCCCSTCSKMMLHLGFSLQCDLSHAHTIA